MSSEISNTHGEVDFAQTEKIGYLMDRFKDLHADTVSYQVGDTILEEGASNQYVYVIVDGMVDMLKLSRETEHQMQIDAFGPGDLIGLTSFWTKQDSFLHSKARTDVTCLRFNSADFEKLVNSDAELREAIHQLFISNLSGRYRRMISLNVKVAELSEKLENEHRQLKQAMEELKRTRNRLVHQEKLATLGQLIAGIAHEINNPCAALTQGVERLIQLVPDLLEPGTTCEGHALEARALRVGIDCPYWSAEETRERMSQIGDRHPGLKRSQIRRLAQLEDALLASIASEVGLEDSARVDQILSCFEIGTALRGARIASTRIKELVVSLKNYSKQDQEEWQMLDLRDGIRDTLTILNHRLKPYIVDLQLEEIEPTYCIGGEMNQIWTNLLLNASQATPAGGTITIACHQEPQEIVVTVTDTGTGIKEELLEKIFETNFTTKQTKADFGLGLGLAISKEIIEKHGGRIEASHAPGGGSCLTVRVPLVRR